MTLDEAIVHAREAAENLRNGAESLGGYPEYKHEIGECLDCAEEHEQLADWLEELKQRREADRWVNAKERKPEKDGVYLVVVEFQHILLVTYYDVENEHWGTADDVIAWRPLPEYKESEGE